MSIKLLIYISISLTLFSSCSRCDCGIPELTPEENRVFNNFETGEVQSRYTNGQDSFDLEIQLNDTSHTAVPGISTPDRCDCVGPQVLIAFVQFDTLNAYGDIPFHKLRYQKSKDQNGVTEFMIVNDQFRSQGSVESETKGKGITEFIFHDSSPVKNIFWSEKDGLIQMNSANGKFERQNLEDL